MPRHFTSASSEKITLGLGGTNFAFGPGTVGAVVKFSTVNAAQVVFSSGAVGTACFELGITAAGVVSLKSDATTQSGGSALSANTWYLIGVTKATGTATPVVHICDLAAGSWQQANAGGTLANSTAGATRSALGVDSTGALRFLNGDIAVAACWNVILATSEIRSLGLALNHGQWSGFTAPRGLWIPADAPATAVVDSSGRGANQSAITGTTATVAGPAGINPSAPQVGVNF